MRRTYVLFTIMAVILSAGLFIGCDKSSPVADAGGDVASVELRFSQTLINGIEGEEISIELTAIARDQFSIGVPGADMRFGIEAPAEFKGTISTPAGISTTDENGQLKSTYTVVLAQDVDVVIFALSGQIRITKILQLVSRTGEGDLSIHLKRTVLTVPPDEVRETTVTATLVDDAGLALNGVEVRFSTNPATMGYVDAETATTDVSGRAIRTFSSIVNQYGFCEVIVTVGENTATTTIEIIPVSGPFDITAHADPSIMRPAEGQNVTSTITAVVTDEAGGAVVDVIILFELVGYNGGPIFGSLTRSDTTTNAAGELSTTFNSRGGTGQQWAKVTVLPTNPGQSSPGSGGQGAENLYLEVGNMITGFDEELSATVLLTVEALEDEPASMSLRSSPDFLNLPPDSTGESIVFVTVRDANRNGIQGLAIDYSADFGTLSMGTATDSSGVSIATFRITPETDMPGFEESTEITITAEIPGTGWRQSTVITVLPTSSDIGSLAIETNRHFIWADGPGLSNAEITVILKDADGQSLSGESIIFTSNFVNSVIQSPVNTDSSGRATSYFDDNRVPSLDENGVPDSVVITAKYAPDGLNAFLKIMIREQNPVSNINLFASARQMLANSADSTAVRATCSLADESPAPAGTRVFFNTDNGSFTEAVSYVVGNSGQVTTYYIAGVIVGTARLIASYQEVQDTVLSNIVEIQLISGPPSFVRLVVNPPELITSDPTSVATVTATVTDTSGNPVRRGTYVTFASTLGTITSSAITDSSGDAVAQLRPGVQSGVAVVTALAEGISGRATVTFIAGTPNSISLSADPLNIQVAGGGGVTTSTLAATVKDPNGNLIEAPITVVFELINEPNPPEGCTIGPDDQTFMSRTSNGVAVATLNAGTLIGGKLLRAYTWRDSANDPDNIVEVIISTVSVTSGPPFQLDIDVNDEGQDAGGGAWTIEVSARIWDFHRNPVANLIPVVFTVEPQIANIDPGHTGNEGIQGVPTPGLAYTNLVYNSVNTFDPIEISAVVRTRAGEITGARDHVLPLQEGVLELNVDPANWMFEDGREEGMITCWVVLNDAHLIEINNAPILFTANRAAFGWRDLNDQMRMYYPDPVRKRTGVRNQFNDERPGVATVYLVAEEPDIFLDPFTLEVTVQVNATVEGYDDVSADPDFIFFTRHGR